MFTINPQNQIANKIYKTKINGLYFIKIEKYEDHRGFYAEIARIPELDEVLDNPFQVKQINHSHSKPGVTRGFHREDWNKLVVVTSGSCFCAIADIRPESETFSQYESFLLGPDDNYGCLYITKGLANSLCIPEKNTDYIYFVDELYKNRDKKNDRAIDLFDKDLNVNWPIPREKMIISDRDKDFITLRSLFPDKF